MNSNWKLLPAALLVAVLALAGCGGGSDEPTGPTDEERAAMMEMQEAAAAIEAANAAAMALSNASDDAAVTAAEGLIATAKDEIGDLPAADQAAQLAMLSGAENIVMAQRGRLTAEAEADAAKTEEERLRAEQEAERMRQEAEEARMAAEAMAATAAKLYAGISVPTATDTDTADTDTATGTRFAQHAAADGENAGDIEVAIGAAANVFLAEDKETMVANNHGWVGKRYTRTTPASEGAYEAYVYSNVEEPTEGKKFGHAGAANDDFEYQLTGGQVAVDTTTTAVQARVGGSSFDQSAGIKEFKLPTNTVAVMIPGTYHGVSGTYSCTPTDGNTCAARVAENGFELGLTADVGNAFTGNTGGWMFRPSDPNARVSEAKDTSYASYGWWLHKAANDGDFTASAFVDELGDGSPAASGLDALNGTATYQGGAAGKYALSSSTGGTNDAGHFTARATLEANFTNNTAATAISGTIDQFMGADGMSRDWSVKLNASAITDGGVIGDAADGTEWTIGGTAAADDGSWTGTLRNNGDDGVPKVATGTFNSTYGQDGKMVGAFGANRQ